MAARSQSDVCADRPGASEAGRLIYNEMASHVLAHNLKRVMNILGTGPLIVAIRAA